MNWKKRKKQEIKKNEAAQLKDKNLFDFLPFHTENINDFFSFIDDLTFTKNKLSSEMFYRKNDNDLTFIEALIDLPSPKSAEELNVRTYLSNYFFTNLLEFNEEKNKKFNDKSHQKFYDNQIFSDKMSILNDSISNVIQKTYEDLSKCYTNNSHPLLSINEYHKQIIECIKEGKNKDEINNQISNIFENYFKSFPPIPASNNEVLASLALCDKTYSSVRKLCKENENVKKMVGWSEKDILINYLDKIPDSYYCDNLRSFVISYFSSAITISINILNKNVSNSNIEFTQAVTLPILNEIIKDTLIANKINTMYKTLDANINKKEEIQNQRKNKI